MPNPIFHGSGLSGKGISVAVVDSGVQPDHPKVGKVHSGIHITLEEDQLRFSDDWEDRHGHGTACASVIKRFAPGIELYSIRIADDAATSSTQLIAEAIMWAVLQKIHIINVSLGSKGQKNLSRLEEACSIAYEAGTIIVAAESNDGMKCYPAAIDRVISVGSGGSSNAYEFGDDQMNRWRILAPATRRRVAWVGGGQAFLGGTSLAAARVSGSLALIKERNRRLKAEHIIEEFRRLAADHSAPAEKSSGSSETQSVAKLLGGSLASSRRAKSREENPAPSAKSPQMPRVISAASLAAQLPPISQAVLYPFSKEIHSLVRFRSLLPFKIVEVMDVLGHGQIGVDAGELLNIEQTGIKVTSKNTNSLQKGDGLILGHMDKLVQLRGPDTVGRLLTDALLHNLHVFSFDSLESYPSLLADAQKKGLKWVWPSLAHDQALLEEAYTVKDFPVNVPVLGVFGTRSQQGKFTVQMELRGRFLEAGYSVGQLGTEPHSALFGCDAVFPMGYGARLPFDWGKVIPYLRHQIQAICQYKTPEIIILGSQSGTIPRDPHLQSDCLCLNTLHFLLASRCDAVILCIEPNLDDEEVEYTKHTMHAIQYLGKASVIALACSNKVKNDGPANGAGRRGGFRFLDEAESFSICQQLETVYGKPVNCPAFPEGGRRLFDLVIEFFQKRSV